MEASHQAVPPPQRGWRQGEHRGSSGWRSAGGYDYDDFPNTGFAAIYGRARVTRKGRSDVHLPLIVVVDFYRYQR